MRWNLNSGLEGVSFVEVLASADVTPVLGGEARLAEAGSASKASEEVGTTKSLLFRLDEEPAASLNDRVSA